MGILKFGKTDRLLVPTPPIGFIAMFNDLDTGRLTYKDENSDFHDLHGADGVTVTLPKVYFVSETGNDQTAIPGRMDLPFATIAAAETFAAFGETIHVLPGNYNESDLGVNGVNYHFEFGATLLSNIAFNDQGSLMSVTVTGLGRFGCSTLIRLTQGGSSSFQCHNISASGKLFDITASSINSFVIIEAVMNIHCSNGGNNGELAGASSVYIKAGQEIYCDGGFCNTQVATDNILTLTAPVIKNNSTSGAPTVLYVLGGKTTINGDLIVNNPNTNQGSIFLDGGGNGLVTINGNVYQSGSILIRNRSGRLIINGNVTMTGGSNIGVTEGGITELNGRSIGNLVGPLFTHISGKTFIGGHMMNSGVDPTSHCVLIAGTGFVSRQNATYFSANTNEPLSAASAHTIKTYPGVIYNAAISVNITETVTLGGVIDANLDTEL